ncbi:MAG: IS66 family transposase [Bradyrhizobium sp.]
MDRSDLDRLSREELIELVLRLQRPDKTSRTSSKPPSTDRKERRERAKPGGAKPGHAGHGRELSEEFDRIVEHVPDVCAGCGLAFSGEDASEVISEHDKIDVVPVKPFVERHRRHELRCRGCGAVVAAPMPEALKGTPFGPNLHALATYFKTFQALSYERLQALFADLFGLRVSQGGLMNLLRRAQGSFVAGREAALACLRQAPIVASDETGVRIEGCNSFHWVFRCTAAVVHQAATTRAASVATTAMAGHRPKVWLSDRYSAQQGHGERHQTCLAHLARKVAYAIEVSDDPLVLRLKLWLGSAFALAAGIKDLAASTLAARQRSLERRLAQILAATTTCADARDIQASFRRARDQLMTFCDFKGEVDVTNNACERALRPAVIQRKVTNGYRAMWAATGEADIRTVIDTARLARGASTYAAIAAAVRA